MISTRRPRDRPTWLLPVVLALVSSLATVVTLHRHVFRGWVPSLLSTMYDNDQLGYLAIVANVAHGHSASLEPDTISGLNPYPSGYYTLVGTIARVLHLQPVTAWNATSMTFQVFALTVLGATLAAVARRWWVALLGPLVVLTGCSAWIIADSWLIPINRQGALWGPFGVLFPMNGETAGLSAIVVGISLLALAWCGPIRRPRPRALTTAAASIALGVAANFQTYGFLTGTYVVGAVLAAAALWRVRSRGLVLATALLLAAVLLLGRTIAGAAGSLATLVIGLAPMLPGAIALLRLGRARVLVFPVLYALSAAPMILSTIAVRDTPFMRYRVSSNVALGVESWWTAAASLPFVALMIALAMLGRRRRDPIVTGIGTAFPPIWALVAFNDLWGANAEPYRFWIDGYLLGLVLAAFALARLWAPRTTEATEPAAIAADAASGIAPRRSRARRALVAVSLVAALGWIVSLGDLVHYQTDSNVAQTWDPGSEASREIVEAVGTIEPGDGRLWTTSCSDLREIKILTGAPVAHYHLGMAWPDDVDAVSAAMRTADDREIDLDTLRAAQVRWVLTEKGCDAEPPAGLTAVRTVGNLTLWEVAD